MLNSEHGLLQNDEVAIIVYWGVFNTTRNVNFTFSRITQNTESILIGGNCYYYFCLKYLF